MSDSVGLTGRLFQGELAANGLAAVPHLDVGFGAVTVVTVVTDAVTALALDAVVLTTETAAGEMTAGAATGSAA